MSTEQEPHARGSVLVTAVFDAFLAIYRMRIADLLRIASGGSGILEAGALHPDLVNRLADEAAKSATHLLHICIRALDYCPPVDITSGDYLRAIITADVDMVPDDRLNYRIAIIEAFQRHGIYPADVRNLSLESVVWRPPRSALLDRNLKSLFVRGSGESVLAPEWRLTSSREDLWRRMRANAKNRAQLAAPFHEFPRGRRTGTRPWSQRPTQHLSRPAEATPHPGGALRAGSPPQHTPGRSGDRPLVVELLQRRRGYLDRGRQGQVDQRTRNLPRTEHGDFTFRGGSTLLIDPATYCVRYAITKHILSDGRLEQQRRFLSGEEGSLRATYCGDPNRQQGRATRPREPFAILHRGLEEGGI